MKKKRPPITEWEEDDVGPEQFSTAITTIAVAQICRSVGYGGAQRSALETLTDVAARFLKSLAKYAAVSANSSNRTQSNFLDIVCALEELYSGIGFRGRSSTDVPLPVSGTIAELMRFVRYSREIPFAKPMPRRRYGPCLVNRVGLNCNGGKHIPKWLPQIPVMDYGGPKKVRIGLRWEDEVCLGGETMVGMDREVGEKRKELVLPRKRERVSFKMGSGGMGKQMNEGVELVRSGVCRGGKRISCQSWMIREDDEDEGAENNNVNQNHGISLSSGDVAVAIKQICTER